MTAQVMIHLCNIALQLNTRSRFYTDGEGLFFQDPPEDTASRLIFVGRFDTYEEAQAWWESNPTRRKSQREQARSNG